VTISEEGLRIGSCGKGTGGPEAGAGGRSQEARRSVGEPRNLEGERGQTGQGRATVDGDGNGNWGKRRKEMGFSRALGAGVTSY
jgi:hypothetical protein